VPSGRRRRDAAGRRHHRRPAPVRLFPLPDYYCSHYGQGEAVQSYLETIVPRV
jgi:hypothetical protein